MGVQAASRPTGPRHLLGSYSRGGWRLEVPGQKSPTFHRRGAHQPDCEGRAAGQTRMQEELSGKLQASKAEACGGERASAIPPHRPLPSPGRMEGCSPCGLGNTPPRAKSRALTWSSNKAGWAPRGPEAGGSLSGVKVKHMLGVNEWPLAGPAPPSPPCGVQPAGRLGEGLPLLPAASCVGKVGGCPGRPFLFEGAQASGRLRGALQACYLLTNAPRVSAGPLGAAGLAPRVPAPVHRLGWGRTSLGMFWEV